MSLPIGLQLYSIKDDTAKDFKGSLEKVAEIGYDGVEFAGYGGYKASELKALLDDLGLKTFGSHVGIEPLRNSLENEIEYNLKIGNPYIICPGIVMNKKDDFLAAAEELNSIGEKCKANGLIFGYHNHGHEFKEFDGEYGLDILYNNTSPELVKAEIDTYWVKYAGEDPVDYIKKYAGRCSLLHIKDMELSSNGEKQSTEVGNGIIDVEGLVRTAEKQAVKYLIIEQEFFNIPPIESVKIGFNNLKNICQKGND